MNRRKFNNQHTNEKKKILWHKDPMKQSQSDNNEQQKRIFWLSLVAQWEFITLKCNGRAFRSRSDFFINGIGKYCLFT